MPKNKEKAKNLLRQSAEVGYLAADVMLKSIRAQSEEYAYT